MEKNNKKHLININNYEKYNPIIISVILTVVFEFIKELSILYLNQIDSNGVARKDSSKWHYVLCVVVGAIVFIVLFIVIAKINTYIKNIVYNAPNEEAYMKESFLRLKDLGLKRQKEVLTDIKQESSNNGYLEYSIIKHKKCIGLVVTSCYEFFKESFSGKGNLVNDLCFEVSFMTKSYKDNMITIVASDNDKHRQPPSMIKREENPNIYDKSETAELYKKYEKDPSSALGIQIEEDCSDTKKFVSLYEGQLEKIKSIAVLPVLSSDNKLLGTLVVCANMASFFKKKDSKFWHELLEIYSVELGYHFLALDYYISHGKDKLPENSLKPF